MDISTQPSTLELLGEIGTEFRVSANWFFPKLPGSGSLERLHVVRAKNRRPLSDMYSRSKQELGFEDELLSSTLSDQCYQILSRFPPGSGQPSEMSEGYQFEGEQHAMVLSDQVELRLADEVITLKTGNSFSYPSQIAHRFPNRTTIEARMIWAMSPVRISW